VSTYPFSLIILHHPRSSSTTRNGSRCFEMKQSRVTDPVDPCRIRESNETKRTSHRRYSDTQHRSHGYRSEFGGNEFISGIDDAGEWRSSPGECIITKSMEESVSSAVFYCNTPSQLDLNLTVNDPRMISIAHKQRASSMPR
jgi:hypothetical protein